MTQGSSSVKSMGPLLLLMLAVCLSFWLAPAPQGEPDVEYWGHYVRVAPGLGFVVNHDTYGYLSVAQEPQKLLLPGEVRQSRPLYALLGAAVGYPLTAALRVAGQAGIAPKWWPEETLFYGFYSGFVLLNGLALLASLLLLRRLLVLLTAGRGQPWQFYALAWVLLATPITKAFFWTAHQQMFAFLVPLCCLFLAIRLREQPPLRTAALGGLALGLGVLPLVYGSCVLLWPALAFGLVRPADAAAPTGAARWPARLGKLALSAVLFAVPTLLWIALLKTQGTTYYNHEAERYRQFVWLLDVRIMDFSDYLGLFGSKMLEYLSSQQLMAGWLLLGAVFYAATWWQARAAGTGLRLPAIPAATLGWTAACFALFFALLGYYPERLAYTLLPLVLCLLGALLPYWPGRYARPLVLAGAAGWHLFILLSYGPFS
jgi:hypothetical protein